MFIWVIVGYLGIFIMETAVKSFEQKQLNSFVAKLTFKLRKRIWFEYLYMPCVKYDLYEIGELKNRVDNDMNIVADFINTQVIGALFNIVYAAAYVSALFFMNWKLAIIGVITVPVSFWMTKWLGRKVGELAEEYRKMFGRYEGWLMNSLQSWKEVKALYAAKREEKTFIDGSDKIVLSIVN